MKWLHISDLHIKQCTQWNNMISWFENYGTKNHVDFIVVTGDLHSFREGYDDTKEFLEKLICYFGLTKQDIFIVPGNHDIDSIPNWKYREECLSNIINQSKVQEDAYRKYIDDIKECFGKYKQFVNEFYGDVIPYSDPLGVDNIVWHNQINILHLNSALISDGKEHKQLIDVNQLSTLKINNELPVIAIGHHILNDLFESHQKTINRVFSNLGVSMYLCGDRHKASNELFNYKNDELELPCLVAGITAADPNDSYSDRTFNLFSSVEHDKIKVESYYWDSDMLEYKIKRQYTADSEIKIALKVRKKPVNSTSAEERYKGFGLMGYSLIGGRGIDGIKYFWNKGNNIVESITFNKRVKDNPQPIDLITSAYTNSVSYGCYLSVLEKQCKFCETGYIPFKGYLSAEEIALQNIFMAGYDSDCPSFKEVKDNYREFAFMGQGEPGYMYPIVRQAIILTDIAMAELKQKVSRYIISSCGTQGLIPSLIQDIKTGVFKNKVTLHFSLNCVEKERDYLMPVNTDYNYLDFIEECKKLYELTHDKIGVGILLFNNFKTYENPAKTFSLDIPTLDKILAILDPMIFKIDLCDYNEVTRAEQSDVRNEDATMFLDYIKARGYEGKMSSSFGRENSSGCGMLHSDAKRISPPGNKTRMQLRNAIETLSHSIIAYRGEK